MKFLEIHVSVLKQSSPQKHSLFLGFFNSCLLSSCASAPILLRWVWPCDSLTLYVCVFFLSTNPLPLKNRHSSWKPQRDHCTLGDSVAGISTKCFTECICRNSVDMRCISIPGDSNARAACYVPVSDCGVISLKMPIYYKIEICKLQRK